MTPVLWPKPNIEKVYEQVQADVAKIKTWKDKALFYERVLQSTEVTLFDPMQVTAQDIENYRRTVLLAACEAFDVIPEGDQ